MSANLFSETDRRPDQAHWTRTSVGMASPLWFPFLMAAGAGAAWWTYTNWTRLASTPWTGDLQKGFDKASPAAAPDAAVRETLQADLAVQGAAASEDDMAPASIAGPAEADASDAIDAAYAANLGPVPAPKKRAAKKAAAKPAVKPTPAKAAAKSAAKTAAKSAAKRPAAKSKR